MKLATKIALSFLFLALVPALIVGYTAYDQSQHVIKNNLYQQLTSVSNLKADEFDRWIEAGAVNLQQVASHPLMVQYAAILVAEDRNEPQFEEDRTQVVQRLLLPLLRSQSGFQGLSLLRSSDGQVVISTMSTEEGQYQSEMSYFMAGRQALYVQSIYESSLLQAPAMTVAIPVRDQTGSVIAVLAGHMDISKLAATLAKPTGLNQAIDTYMITESGLFATDPLFGTGYALKQSIDTEGATAGLAHQNGVLLYKDYRGVPVIGVYRWLPKSNLCILTETDQGSAFAPIHKLRTIIAIILAGVAVTGIGLALVFSRTITQPVRRLSYGAGEIGRGNLDYKVGTSASDEIGELSRSFDRMGENLKLLTVSRDELAVEIDERKEIEEKLRHANGELETTLRQLKSSQEQLLQSAKLAAVGQLVAGVAHEVNNPLMAISGYAQLLLDEAQDEGVRNDLKMIESEADRAVMIMRNLLSFARKHDPAMVPVAINQSIEDAVMLRAHQLSLDKIKVIYDLGTDLPDVNADNHQLQQVFLNLVNNAEQAMKEAHEMGTLVIKTRSDGETTRITFTDDGPGIPPQNIKKIFDPFFTTKDIGKGTGLGLSICYGIIKEHGGKIYAESNLGEGATFIIELPVFARESSQCKETALVM